MTKYTLFKDALRKALAANDGKAVDDIARVLIAQARTGDLAAIREIIDRLEGKPLQSQEISAPRGVAVPVINITGRPDDLEERQCLKPN